VPSHLVRCDLGLIYPPFLAKHLELLARCQARGAYYFWISGFRDPSEQTEKYAQGRTTKAPDWATNPPLGTPITNAKPGLSMHNYGLAADNARDADLVKVGLQPEWNDPTAYAILKEEGEKLGLQVGVPTVKGGDPGHVQLRLSRVLKDSAGRPRREASVLLELRGLYVEGKTPKDGLLRVWKRLDEWGFGS
jgi:hypothetical protein